MKMFSNKQLVRVFRAVYIELYSLICTLFGSLKARTVGTQLRHLELGAGLSARKKGFVTCDLSFKSDFPCDLRAGLPFRDECMDLIYSEHVLEHFTYREIIDLLHECYRVLAPGGMINIVVPDAEIYIRAYNDDQGFDRKKFCVYDFGLPFEKRIDYLNYIFYMDGHHRHMFDRESIKFILEDQGFCDVTLREFEPDFDLNCRHHESIYVLGTKPSSQHEQIPAG